MIFNFNTSWTSYLQYLTCAIPCIWPGLCFICIMLGLGHFSSGMLYQGVLPSDGPAEFKGFSSKQERIDWWDTSARRLRGKVKSVLIFGPAGIVGGLIIWGLYALIKAAVA